MVKAKDVVDTSPSVVGVVVDDLSCSRVVGDDVILAESAVGTLVFVVVEDGVGVLSSTSVVDVD